MSSHSTTHTDYLLISVMISLVNLENVLIENVLNKQKIPHVKCQNNEQHKNLEKISIEHNILTLSPKQHLSDMIQKIQKTTQQHVSKKLNLMIDVLSIFLMRHHCMQSHDDNQQIMEVSWMMMGQPTQSMMSKSMLEFSFTL